MQIIIDIPEELYNRYMNYTDNYVDFVFVGAEETIVKAIRKGAPLPKSHRRLIYEPTKEEIEKTIGGQSDFAECIRDSVKAVFDNTTTIIEADKYMNETIPTALSGACFHGEIWLKCPHCGSGNQIMGRQALYKEDGYRIYKCDECGKLFKDR